MHTNFEKIKNDCWGGLDYNPSADYHNTMTNIAGLQEQLDAANDHDTVQIFVLDINLALKKYIIDKSNFKI